MALSTLLTLLSPFSNTQVLMRITKTKITSCFLFFLIPFFLFAQEEPSLKFLQPADTLNKKRFWLAAASGATAYTATVIGLNEAWYADFPRSSFHFFNDSGEWEDMDKIGHSYTTYLESRWSFQAARWTGMPRRKAMWLGAGLGMMYQMTIEVFDGFSEKWGFSTHDIGFNTLGALTFVGQELAWQEQRISLKFSSVPKSYPDFQVISQDGQSTTTLNARADNLYGKSFAERILKDYNSQSYWASVNVASFIQHDNHKFPKWLNVAVGYGAENMFGGFENSWVDGEFQYTLDDNLYPRHRQFFLSPDVDFTKIKTDRPFLKTLFFFLNTFKVPAPAVEVNTLGKLKWHWLK